MASHAPPKMGRELQSALGDDALAKARNDAKLRAVTQRVDYDTFKQMVRCHGTALAQNERLWRLALC